MVFSIFSIIFLFINCDSEDIDDFSISPQFGKKIALFGGSFACYEDSNYAIDYWCEKLNLKMANYSSGGAGFSNLTKSPTLQEQVDSACRKTAPVYDIYLFWASTNDFYLANPFVGNVDDYTNDDGYDDNKLNTQCGGINYCFKKIKEKNPRALILFMTSIGYYRELGKGTSPTYEGEDGMNVFVNLQKAVCTKWNVPCLDQFNVIINESNWTMFLREDKLHLNKKGYIAIREAQMKFIANPI